MRRSVAFAFFATMLAALPAQGAVTLLAQGTLGGSTDLSGLTYSLENGLPANVLGGLGSGLAYAGGNTFIALPDRGPNATPYNSAVDDTVSYINRFHTVTLDLTASGAGAALPFQLTPTLTGTTLLSSTDPLVYGSGAGLGNQINGQPLGTGAPALNAATGRYYFTGRSDNFAATGGSGNASSARLDPESVRVSNDGKSVFVSDEYGPYVRQFDRATGVLQRTFTLPTNLDIANPAPVGATEISGNTSGRTANKGMEGLAITPDGKTLVGIMQAALIQDAATKATKKLLRIVTVDIASGTTHEYGYTLTSGSGVSEIVAINDHQFLVDERDGVGLGGDAGTPSKVFYKIDLTGATDITGLSGTAAAGAAVAKTQVVDLVALLKAAGYTDAQIPSKIEGLSFGADVTYDGQTLHTLYVANDNDFVPGTAGDNRFFVLGLTDGDLGATYVAQALGAVPEPASWATMLAGFALVGAALRRRRRAAVRFG